MTDQQKINSFALLSSVLCIFAYAAIYAAENDLFDAGVSRYAMYAGLLAALLSVLLALLSYYLPARKYRWLSGFVLLVYLTTAVVLFFVSA